MPFDNTNPETKPATDEVLEVLQFIREGVSSAWCVGSVGNSIGEMCLVGWIGKVTKGDLAISATAQLLASQLPPCSLRSTNPMSRLWRWNDSQLSNQPVIALIDRAIEARKKV